MKLACGYYLMPCTKKLGIHAKNHWNLFQKIRFFSYVAGSAKDFSPHYLVKNTMDSFTTAWGIFAEIFVWGICWINIFLQNLVLFDVLINFLVLLDKFAALNSHKSHKFPKCFGKKYFPRFFLFILFDKGNEGIFD
jgi:hypothetical protein